MGGHEKTEASAQATVEKVLRLESGELWIRTPAERYNQAARAALESYGAYLRKIRETQQ